MKQKLRNMVCQELQNQMAMKLKFVTLKMTSKNKQNNPKKKNLKNANAKGEKLEKVNQGIIILHIIKR